MNNTIDAGPNAVLALQREGYKKTDISLKELKETLQWPGFQKVAKKYWKIGLLEYGRSLSKYLFARSLARLVPQIQASDLISAGAGVRAQVCMRDGNLVDDFLILQDTHAIHVCNTPSPAATSCLAIGESIVETYLT